MTKHKVIVSRATFAELAKAIGIAGHTDIMKDDGTLTCGDLVIAHGYPEPRVRAVRQAQIISDLVFNDSPAVYSDERTVVQTTRAPDGIHLIERTSGGCVREVVLPTASLALVATDLIGQLEPSLAD
jgi:hypothetical protein